MPLMRASERASARGSPNKRNKRKQKSEERRAKREERREKSEERRETTNLFIQSHSRL
jgi:ribosomal protein L12E/L44/L45/RPP1/RPP2